MSPHIGISAASLALMLALAPVPAKAADAPLGGTWRVVLDHPGGGLPFGLEVSADAKKAWILNPPERLPVEKVSRENGALKLAFPSYGSEILLKPDGKGLSGTARLVRGSGPVTLPLAATRERYRFSPKPGSPAAVAGKWSVRTEGARPSTGAGQLQAAGPLVTGSVQFPTGDTRYLAGDFTNGVLKLSTFDGNQSSLWIGRLEGGKLVGEQWSATSRQPVKWQAERAASGGIEPVEIVRLDPKPLGFAFPDSSGAKVSLSDPRYRGKVVLVSIGGAWCPNCHDEARFLGPYALKRAKEGLEVVGLQFEYGGDKAQEQARAFRQLDSFAARYKLPYPLLLAGAPTPESTRAALPEIGGVKVYPSLLLVDRKGRLREVHVGWAGPATGDLHAKAVKDLDLAVSRLLKEPA